jgi:hypothetical protein
LPETFEALTNSLGRRPARRSARADDDVYGGQSLPGVPERFANYATKFVASDGVADDFRADGKPEPGCPRAVRAHGH